MVNQAVVKVFAKNCHRDTVTNWPHNQQPVTLLTFKSLEKRLRAKQAPWGVSLSITLWSRGNQARDILVVSPWLGM